MKLKIISHYIVKLYSIKGIDVVIQKYFIDKSKLKLDEST